MATPSSPIGFSNIYSEANGVAPVSPTSLGLLTYQRNYFQGPNGSNIIGYNTWGQNQSIDGIYAVQTIAPSPVSFNDYRNVSYFYDQSQYQISLQITNNAADNFSIVMYYMDSSLTYNYLVANAGTVAGSSTFGPSEMSSATTPLIYGCNWKLQIDTDPFYVGGSTVDLNINSSALISAASIPVAFPAPTFWDYNTYGNEYMTLNQPVTGATGSFIDITIN